MPVDILRNKKQKQKRMTSDDMQIKWHEDDNNTKKHVYRMWKNKVANYPDDAGRK